MRFLAIVFVAFVIGAQCHSLAVSNVKEAEKKSAACIGAHRSARIHRDASQDMHSTWIKSSASINSVNSTNEKIPSNIPQRLKDLIASYEENIANFVEYARKICKNKNDGQREGNFQAQLESLVKSVVKEQSKVRNAYAKLGNFTASTLQVPSKKLTIENVNNLKDLLDIVKELDIVYQNGEINDEHVRIKRTNDGYKGAASFVVSDREERVIQMLFDIQRQLTQIRKYLDKLCNKHHATWTTTMEVNPVEDVSPVDQPNKVPIIQN